MSKTYKYSKYNIIIPSQSTEEVTIFNTYTSKYITLPLEVYEEIHGEENIEEGDFPSYLINLGIFVPNDLDEYERVLNRSYNYAHKENKLHFVIQLSLRCNYRCYYCYQKESLCNTEMAFETMDATVAFIIKKCEEAKELKHLVLQWYGGEPTLSEASIFYINKKIKEYVQEKGLVYETNITTNGNLLTKGLVNKLVDKANLKAAQITIDSVNNYAKIKGCKPEDITKVINNIKYAQNKIGVNIRLNIGEEIEPAKEVITYVANEKLNVSMLYAHIWDTSMPPQEYQASFGRYVELVKELDSFIIANNYNYLFPHINNVQPKCVACPANCCFHYAIGVNGKLYRCVEKITEPQYSIGDVVNGITNTTMDALFIENKYANILGCEKNNCAYLPQCLGRCTMESLVEQKGVNCEAMKQLTINRIKRFIESTI